MGADLILVGMRYPWRNTPHPDKSAMDEWPLKDEDWAVVRARAVAEVDRLLATDGGRELLADRFPFLDPQNIGDESGSAEDKDYVLGQVDDAINAIRTPYRDITFMYCPPPGVEGFHGKYWWVMCGGTSWGDVSDSYDSVAFLASLGVTEQAVDA